MLVLICDPFELAVTNGFLEIWTDSFPGFGLGRTIFDQCNVMNHRLDVPPLLLIDVESILLFWIECFP